MSDIKFHHGDFLLNNDEKSQFSVCLSINGGYGRPIRSHRWILSEKKSYFDTGKNRMNSLRNRFDYSTRMLPFLLLHSVKQFKSITCCIDPQMSQLISNDTTNQTKEILKNFEAILVAAGSSVQQIAHWLIILTNIDRDYSIVNDIYSKWFSSSDYDRVRSSIGVIK